MPDLAGRLFTTVILFAATAATAQDAIPRLAPITVIGSGVETSVLRNPSSVYVVTAQQIDRAPKENVAEMLRSAPGVIVQDSSVPGIERISIRGEDPRRTVILLDGQPLTDPTTYGQPVLIDPETVERIEVVRGASSVVNGSRAIGGVVNIITKGGGAKPIEGAVTGAYFTGARGFRLSGTVAGAAEGFEYRLSGDMTRQGDRRTPDGRLEPSGFNQEALSAHLGYSFGRHRVSAKAQRFTMDAETYTGDPNFSIDLPKRDLTKFALFYEGRDLTPWLAKLTADAYLQTVDRQFENRIVAGPGRITGSSDDLQRAFGFNLRGELALFDGQRTAVGLQYENDFLDADGETRITGFGPPSVSSRRNKARIQTWSAFVNHEAQLTEKLTGYAGARVYAVNAELESSNTQPLRDNSDVRVLGAVGLVYAASDALSLRANVAQGYSYPTLSQMFLTTTAAGQTIIGNPDLKPETALTFEIGGRYAANGAFIDATLFHTRSKNYIGREPLPGPGRPRSTYVNVDSAQTFGLELEAEAAIGDSGFTPYVSATLLRRKFDYGGGGSTWDSGVPTVTARAGLRYDWNWGAHMSGGVDAYLQGQSGATRRSRSGAVEDGDGYATLNLAAHADLHDRLRVGVSLTNILDHDYDALDETPGVGRSVSAFATLRF